MKCYNHHDRDAFGICTVCGKGLCLECMDAKKGAVICKNDKCRNSFRIRQFLPVVLSIVVIAGLLFLVLD